MVRYSLLDAPRSIKRLIMVAADLVFLPCAIALALMVRGVYSANLFQQGSVVSVMLLTTFVSVFFFARLGLYRAVVRFMGREALIAVLKGCVISVLTLTALNFSFDTGLPRSIPLIYGMLTLFLVGGSRFFVREYVFSRAKPHKKKVAIYGAGTSGLQLMASLEKNHEYAPIVLVDDRPERLGAIYQGVKVRSPENLPYLVEKYNLEQVLLAIPSVPRWQRKEILAKLEPLPVRVKTIPSFEQLVSGDASVEQTHDVAIEDLLGREPVEPISSLTHACIKDKTVLVTGAGGSIGSELCRQILKANPISILLFERSEFALYQIERELQALLSVEGGQTKLVPLLGCIQQKDRISAVLSAFNVDTIYHAAAYKHVPMVEQNIVDGVRNNVLGTFNVAKSALDAGVPTFVLISTDKAVRPTNVMGASKRLAELVLQGLSQQGSSTTFCMVRFGNVLGSSGSVVPLFRQQILSGGPVTVTHPEIIRYFMTIPEAAQLVLQASAMAVGGDVFVLDMGEPVKIAELAKTMIHLMGLEVRDEHGAEGDIALKYTGLRQGEKLFEELLIGDNVSGTAHPRIMRADELSLSWADVQQVLRNIELACEAGDCERIRELLLNSDAGYAPNDGLNDTVWRQAAMTTATSVNVVPIKRIKKEKC